MLRSVASKLGYLRRSAKNVSHREHITYRSDSRKPCTVHHRALSLVKVTKHIVEAGTKVGRAEIELGLYLGWYSGACVAGCG